MRHACMVAGPALALECAVRHLGGSPLVRQDEGHTLFPVEPRHGAAHTPEPPTEQANANIDRTLHGNRDEVKRNLLTGFAKLRDDADCAIQKQRVALATQGGPNGSNPGVGQR